MRNFKQGDLVIPSAGCKSRWAEQVYKAKKGKVIASIFDGTKDLGGMAYRIEWDNGHINTYNPRDVDPFNIVLENK